MAVINPASMQTPRINSIPLNVVNMSVIDPVGLNPSSGETMYFLQQVNSRILQSYPMSAVFEFRITQAGTLSKAIFDARDNLVASCTFDINLGTRISNVATLFPAPGDRPVIPIGTYTIEKVLSQAVVAGQLISVDIDAATDILRFLGVRLEITTV